MSPILGGIGGVSVRGFGQFINLYFASFESIATTTLTGNSSTVTFSSIPSTYQHLQVRIIGRTDRAADVTDQANMRFNGDSGSNYSDHYLSGNGSSVTGGQTQSTSIIGAAVTTATSANASAFGASVIDILDYGNTNKYKTVRINTGNAVNIVQMKSGNWRNTNAISSITFIPNVGSNFVSGSRFALYGIRG